MCVKLNCSPVTQLPESELLYVKNLYTQNIFLDKILEFQSTVLNCDASYHCLIAFINHASLLSYTVELAYIFSPIVSSSLNSIEAIYILYGIKTKCVRTMYSALTSAFALNCASIPPKKCEELHWFDQFCALSANAASQNNCVRMYGTTLIFVFFWNLR